MKDYEMIKFRDNEFELDVNVSPEEDTVWLTKDQIALLFNRDRTVISRHINNIYKEGELDRNTSVQFLHISLDNVNPDHRPPQYYNLDVVISVGYRVKSQRGILFRRWANNVLKQYLLKGYVIDGNKVTISKESFIALENDVELIKQEIKDIKEKTFIEPVKERLFYNGQYYDAYDFVSSLISNANKSVCLIDPYFDISGLNYFKRIHPGVDITICCSSDKVNILESDISIFKKQYGNIAFKTNNQIHDRFLIIDNKECYSLGTSLNYMGKRVFTITKIETNEVIKSIINLLNT